MHPRHKAKPRGKKNKEKQRKKRQQTKRSLLETLSNFRELTANTPENLNAKKRVARMMTLSAKYWGMRSRLLLNQYKPFHREMGKSRFFPDFLPMWKAHNEALIKHDSKVRRLRSFKIF